MALIRNGSNQLTSLSRFSGAVAAHGLKAAFGSSGRLLNFDSGEHAVSGVTNRNSRPAGARHPVAWKMPTKDGGLASHNSAQGSCTATLTLAAGRNIAGTSDGACTASASLQLVVSMVGTSDGAATVTGNLSAALGLSGTSAGTCTTSAAWTALWHMAGASAGSCTASLVSYATGRLVGEITPFTDLSPQNLASAVWSATAADNNASGSMGEKLNDAGSASNPWTEVIESGYTAAEILKLLAAVAQGDASGLTGASPVFKSIDGTKNRVTATQSGGNRTVTARDVS